MTTIAILGRGRVGTSLARGLSAAGHQVIFGSRSPVPVELDVRELSLAATGADVVINAVPGSVALEVLRGIGASNLAGKILVDVGNALAEDFTLLYPNASLGAAIQEEFPDTKVVKTLNTVTAPLMANPNIVGPMTVFLSGDDDAAKAVVAELLSDLGWTANAQLDLGGIETSRAPEHFIFLSMAIMRALGTTDYGIGVQTAL